MKTKLMMISSAAYYLTVGIVLTFMPQEVNSFLTGSIETINTLIAQTLGASLLAFALLNWMTRANILGGIYGKPLMMANFLFFFTTTMAYVKTADSMLLWIMAAISAIFAAWFGFVTFTHPLDK